MQVAACPAHEVAELTAEGRRERLQDRDVAAPALRRCRHFAPDEPGTDDDDPPTFGELLAKAQRVGKRPQHMYMRHSFGAREVADPSAGGDDEPVERDVAGRCRHAATIEVECRRGHPEAEVKVELPGDVLGGPELDAVRLPRPGEELFREWRPVVGMFGLVADQRDRASEAAVAKRLRRAHAGKGRTDDDDAVVTARRRAQPSSEMACVGHSRTASKAAARWSSPGSSMRT